MFVPESYGASGYSNQFIVQPVFSVNRKPGSFLEYHVVRPTLPILEPNPDPDGPIGDIGSQLWVESDGKVGASIDLTTSDFRAELDPQHKWAEYGTGTRLRKHKQSHIVAPSNAGLQDLQGSEFYYNAEINPWFHLTGDIQVIETEIASQDTALDLRPLVAVLAAVAEAR